MYVVALYHNLYSNEGKFFGYDQRPTAIHQTPAPYRARARVTLVAELAMMYSYICCWLVVAMLGASRLRLSCPCFLIPLFFCRLATDI